MVRTIGEVVKEYLQLLDGGQAAARLRQIEDELRGRHVTVACDWYQDGRPASGRVMAVEATGCWVSTAVGTVQVDLERLQPADVAEGSGNG